VKHNGYNEISGRNGDGSHTLRPAFRCAVYCRKSTDENMDNDFNSLVAQREAALSFIKSQSHENWIAIPDNYDDGGFSGSTTDRPALQRLLQDVEAGKIDKILIYKLDRLSRSLLDFTKLIEFLEQKKVSLISVTQSFDTSTSMGRLTLNILLSFAQFEREITIERIKDKMGSARKKGKYIGGKPILGYDADPDKKILVINPEEAKLVRYIFKRFVQKIPLIRLANELNEKGYKTKCWKSRKGKVHGGISWNKCSVFRLLKNHTYAGMVYYKGKQYKAEHLPIIDITLWNEAQAVFSENSHARGNQARSKTPALLRGIIRCGHHDAAMVPTYTRKNGKIYRYYLCTHAIKQGYEKCPTRLLPAGTAEKAVVDKIRGIFRSPEIIQETFKSAIKASTSRLEEIERIVPREEESLRELQSEADRLMDVKNIKPGHVPFLVHERLKNFGIEIENKRSEIEKLKNEKNHLESDCFNEGDVKNALESIDKLWDELFPDEQARVVNLLVERAVVYQNNLDLFIRADGMENLIKDLTVKKGNENASGKTANC